MLHVVSCGVSVHSNQIFKSVIDININYDKATTALLLQSHSVCLVAV